MKRTGIAGLMFLSLAVPVAAHADVTVRVEGAETTLVPQTTVPRTGPDVVRDGATCPGDSAGGALERATGGDWEGSDFGFGVSVDAIRGESYPFPSPKYWAFDYDNYSAPVGACGYTLEDGDEILFYAACASATTGCFTGRPLDVTAPATATTGVPFTVTVREFDDTKEPAVASPAAGASIGGQTTDAEGRATLTITQPGPVTLVATKGQQVRDSATVTVSDPPAYPIPGGPVVTPEPSVAPDTQAPFSTIRRIKEQQVFRKRRRAPRTLRATIEDASSLSGVQLSITRRLGKRCTAFDDTRGRFARVRCGRHPRFGIGTEKTVSFLLPARLGPGRYVFDVVATDAAGNEESLARGRNRVVFRVR